MEGVTLYLVSPLVVFLKSLMSVGSVTDLILISLLICSSSFCNDEQFNFSFCIAIFNHCGWVLETAAFDFAGFILFLF